MNCYFNTAHHYVETCCKDLCNSIELKNTDLIN